MLLQITTTLFSLLTVGSVEYSFDSDLNLSVRLTVSIKVLTVSNSISKGLRKAGNLIKAINYTAKVLLFRVFKEMFVPCQFIYRVDGVRHLWE